MSDDADRELSALIVREQRGFRVMMYWGVGLLIVIALMSAGLGLYYRQAHAKTERDLARQEFFSRREMQRQANEINNQRISIQSISDELRRMGGFGTAATGSALTSARAYLERGQLGMADARLIDAAAHSGTARGAERLVLQGVAELVAFDLSGRGVQANDPALPQRLQRAQDAFEQARADPALGSLAQLGLAQVLFAEAQRASYTEAACQALFDAEAAIAGPNGRLPPQPLYWRANCERKLGRTEDALRDYAAMLEQSAEARSDEDADYARLELAMNAFHGVGTTLIAMHGADANNAAMQAGLAVAQRECGTAQQAGRSPEMRLAIACLNQAMELRRRMGQNESQVAGTGENLGFAYLRDNLFENALEHANATAQNTLSAWNELLRALAAEHVADEQSERAGREARRNISFFTPSQFDLCEVRRLLSPELYRQAVEIVRREHPGEEIPCAE